MADEHGQNTLELAQEIVGPATMIEGAGPTGTVPRKMRTGVTQNHFSTRHFSDVDPIWYYGFIFSPALTIGGGTWAVQRNIVAEHVLGHLATSTLRKEKRGPRLEPKLRTNSLNQIG